MNIGIIGAGALGANLAKALANKGLSAMISNSRGPESLRATLEKLGPTIKAVTTAEAAKADIVVLAVRWVDLPAVLAGLPAWKDRIVIDGTNPVAFLDPDSPDAKDPNNPLAQYGIKAVDLGGRLSSEVVSELVPGARLVKAFNHFNSELLPQPDVSGGRRVLFYSGDDVAAKTDVRTLIEQLGLFPVDLGQLKVGGALSTLPFGSLGDINFIKI